MKLEVANKIQFSEPPKDVQLVTLSLGKLESSWMRREEDAFERGRAEGERSLHQQLIQQRLDMQYMQNGLLQQLREALSGVIRECEQTVVAIAFEVARKVVNTIEITPQMVEVAVREALGSLEDSGRIRVLLHPEDLALLESINSPLRHEEIGGTRVQFEVSTAVGRGGCLIQTDFGSLDARRESKFELLRQSIEL